MHVFLVYILVQYARTTGLHVIFRLELVPVIWFYNLSSIFYSKVISPIFNFIVLKQLEW